MENTGTFYVQCVQHARLHAVFHQFKFVMLLKKKKDNIQS